jgi:hypothetical protein
MTHELQPATDRPFVCECDVQGRVALIEADPPETDRKRRGVDDQLVPPVVDRGGHGLHWIG